MHMANVTAQVVHRGLRSFAKIAVRMVHIPQGGDFRPVHFIEQRAQALGIGIHAVGFAKQRHARALGHIRQLQQHFRHIIVVHFPGHGAIQIRKQSNIGRTQLFRQAEIFPNFVHDLLTLVLEFQAPACGKAGNAKVKAGELRNGLVNLARREWRRGNGINVFAQAADLDAIELEVLGHRINIHPAKIRAAQGRKADPHKMPTSHYTEWK